MTRDLNIYVIDFDQLRHNSNLHLQSFLEFIPYTIEVVREKQSKVCTFRF